MCATPTAVSLFSGCGGFDFGVAQAGFEILAATDIWDVACATLRKNRLTQTVVECDVMNFLPTDFGIARSDEIDLLYGGPPCPPYSKSRFYRTESPRALDDPASSKTLEHYLRVLMELRPRTFMIENVPGLAFKVHSDALNLILGTAARLGYATSYKILNAADFGVPQIRERLFIVGWLDKSKQFVFPEPTHVRDEVTLLQKSRWVTAGEAISDLDTEQRADDEGHRAGGKHAALLKEVPPGDNYLYFTSERGHPKPEFKWRSRYWSFLLKLSPDRPSWTIQARRSNNMGPFHWRNRILRIEEIKRLQSFDDSYEIVGTTDAAWRQVGNAVPPKLAEVLARQVRRQLLGEKSALRWDSSGLKLSSA